VVSAFVTFSFLYNLKAVVRHFARQTSFQVLLAAQHIYSPVSSTPQKLRVSKFTHLKLHGKETRVKKSFWKSNKACPLTVGGLLANSWPWGWGEGTLKKIGEGVTPTPQIPYPIYDQVEWFSLPYLGMTWTKFDSLDFTIVQLQHVQFLKKTYP